MITKRTCLGCGKSLTGRANKVFCDGLCGAKHRHKLKDNDGALTGRLHPGNELIGRIIGENFFLGALDEELALLAKNAKRDAKTALETKLRQTIIAGPEWPHSVAGRCALILWLLDHPGAEHGRFHHLFEKVKRPGEVRISGTMIRAGIGRAGSGT